MPAEDRDRLFEKALARHLRGGAGDDSACPDAERLAAYCEGSLSAEEMSATSEHSACCARCQEILAQLAATQSVSESRNQEDQWVAAGAVARAKNAEASREASAPSDATRTAKEAESAVAHFPTQKKWLLRWAAPAGAIAAGLLLYLSFRDFRSPAKRAEPATPIAQNREDNARARDSYAPPAASQKVPQAPPTVAPKQDHDHLALHSSRQQSAQPAPGVLLDELKALRSEAAKHAKQEKKSFPPVPSPAPMAGANANVAQSGGRVSAVEDGKNAAKAKTAVAADKSVVAGAMQNERDAEQSQSLQGQASGAATGAPAASPSAPPPPPYSSQQVTVTAAAPESSNETAEVSPLDKKAANLPMSSRKVSDLALLPPRMVVAPNGKSIWRFGEHGTIAHSGDGGKTWKSQEMPVTANLTSGSAPAKNICWIAGAAGTLLYTTDGGKHWHLIVTPIAGDLGGVLGSDGKHATIWDLPRRATYQTSDGGKTWEKKAEN